MKLAASQQLYAHWAALRGARSAPERNDIDPGAIRGVLADTFILEFDPPDFPLRIVGSRMNALFQRELRGESFLSLWRESDRAELSEIVAAVADEAQPFLIGAAAAPVGAPAVEAEALLLPLRHHGATHARILGSLSPGVIRGWFGLLPAAPLAMTTLRALKADEKHGNIGLTKAFAQSPEFIRRGHLFVYSAQR